MPLERTELTAPLGLELVEKGLHGHQRLRLEPEDPDPGIFGDPLVLHYPRTEQDLQVATQRRWRHTGGLGQLSRPIGPTAQQLDHLSSSWIGQGLEHIHQS